MEMPQPDHTGQDKLPLPTQKPWPGTILILLSIFSLAAFLLHNETIRGFIDAVNRLIHRTP